MNKVLTPLTSALVLTIMLIGLLPTPVVAQEAVDDFALVDAYVEELRATSNVPGMALAIVRDGEIVYERGYGYADAQGRPLTPTTPMLIGSVSKSFTSLAIMQLVEAGKLELDAPVSRYLPWFERPESITVRHLLTQTSGFSTLEGRQDFNRPADDPQALEKVARRMVNAPLAYPPGKGWTYSNANYTLLGLLVEVASGQTYEDYMAGHIFKPLDMAHTYTDLEEARANHMSSGYIFALGQPVKADDLPYPRALLPVGYIISTADDMGRYAAAMLGKGPAVISATGLAELHRPQAIVQGVSAGQYAFGWFVDKMAGQTLVWHSGDVPNFHGNLTLAPESGWGVVLLFNVNSAVDKRGIDTAAFEAMGILLGHEPGSLATPQLSMQGMYPIFMGVFGLALVLQMVLIILSVRTLRRWQHQLRARPRPGWRRWAAVLLPLALNLGLASLLLFGVLHAGMQSTLLTAIIFQPDLGIMIALMIGLALQWGLVRTLWSGWLLLRAA
jgi:CubicO group peptidase (beta-lactamase class C family)